MTPQEKAAKEVEVAGWLKSKGYDRKTWQGMSKIIVGYLDEHEYAFGLPLSLTAENGAKGLLNGEFFEDIEVANEGYCGCGECDFCDEYPNEPETITQQVPVQWTTIKSIYQKIVEHYSK